jgi:hypothetical protein
MRVLPLEYQLSLELVGYLRRWGAQDGSSLETTQRYGESKQSF